MRKKFFILILCFFAFVFANPEYEKIVQEMEATADSSHAIFLKEQLLQNFPASEKAFEIAQKDFYNKVYPVWKNDSLKVEIISRLITKYAKNDWQRTMFQYFTYSLNNLGMIDSLRSTLALFRQRFPADYIAYFQSAYYHHQNKLENSLEFAEKAFDLAWNYPKLEYYPPLQWKLEKRSAPIKAAVLLGEILIENKKYDKAEKILLRTVNENKLGVNDEATLAGCHFSLAKVYEQQNKQEKAVQHAIKTLIAGDSRNRYPVRADSLLRRLIAYKDLSENEYFDFIRKQADYHDVIFQDVTKEVGLAGIKASRIAWGDFNQDGFADLLLNGKRLFINEKGKNFRDISDLVFADTIKANGGLWADLDNDGDLDIVTKDPEAVWLNENLRFQKSENSLSDNQVSTEGVGIADVNKDGWLDIYLANYEVWEENISNPEQDQFFLGKGKGRFSESTKTANLIPIDEKNRAGRGVNMADFDKDNDIDIFVSNYRLQDNFLWLNDGKGNFRNVALEKGVAGNKVDGWWGHTIGSCWGDIDNDCDLDLFCANLAHPRYIDFSNKSMLYLNNGNFEFDFIDIREQAGIRFEETHSEPILADFNNDGNLDLFINCVYENRRSFLYLNNGDATFRDVTFLAGVRHFNGWGCAVADFDNDGDLDLLAAGGKIQLFRNETGSEKNWLQIKIIGKDHCDGIGTKLLLSKIDFWLYTEIFGSKGTTNQNEFVRHFGLGKIKPPFDLELTFPDGEKRHIPIDAINRKIVIEE